MKRLIWVLAAGAIAIVAGFSLIALPNDAEWTTSSPEALEAFDKAMEAADKLYYRDAVDYCEHALMHDPDFVAAKIQLASMLKSYDSKRAKRLRDDVVNTKIETLKPREQLMVERLIAFRNNQPEKAWDILENYLERYPDDSYALSIKAGMLFHDGELEAAERLYNRVVDVNPNAVLPYNQLGYIAMQMGRFAEAEEHFTSYRFIAPDQANPHDSLGELFVILGRYQEAAECFEKAISIKDDFWNSYVHLIVVRVLRKEFDLARQTLERAAEADAMPERSIEALRCSADSWRLVERQAWQEIVDAFESDDSCMSNPMSMDGTITTVHRAACVLGRFDLAEKLEERVEGWTKDKASSGEESVSTATPGLWHMYAVHLASTGDYPAAEELFLRVDDSTRYKNADEGLFKLYNRLMLVELLLAEGRQADAYSLLSQVRVINPTMAADFEEQDLRILDLERPS